MAQQSSSKRGKRHLKPVDDAKSSKVDREVKESKSRSKLLKITAEKSRSKNSNKRAGGLGTVFRIVAKILVPPYIRNSWKELRMVTWPDWKQSRQLTFAVLVFAIIFGAAVALVDTGLDKIFKHILLK